MLVQKVVAESSKIAGTLFGYYERRRSTASHYGVEQLHAMIKDGAKFGALHSRLDSLADAVHRFADQAANPAPIEPKPSTIKETIPAPAPKPQKGPSDVTRPRIEALLRDAYLEGKPSIAFAAAPATLASIPSLTQSSGDAVRLLLRPPMLRRAGFGLGSYDACPLMKRGQQRRAIIPGYKALELWRDGTFLFVATGDEEFLGWHTVPKDGRPFVINPLVVAEATYLFCETYRMFLSLMSPPPEEVQYVLEVRRLDAPGVLPTLRPEKVLEFPLYLTPAESAPSGGEAFAFTAPAGQAAEETAFQYLREFYLWFGIEEDLIPYTSGEPGSRRVKLDELK